MKLPSILDLAKDAQNDLKSKEELLKELEKDTLNAYIVISLKGEIHDLKFILSKFKTELRNEKLNDLGI